MAGLALGVTACGSSSGGGSALKRADLVSKANAICATAQKDAAAVKAPSNIQDASAAAAYFDKIAPITDKETTDLKALKPADDVSADWNGFVAAQSSANDLLQTIKSKADKKDASGLQDLAKAGDVGQKVVTAAKKLGATSCAA